MYRRLKIRNFRGFSDLDVDGLARVNLITGKNDVGKTALMEAVFLHSGKHSAAMPAILESIRGRERAELKPLSVWGWLFPNKCVKRAISITVWDDNERESRLEISLGANKETKSLPYPEEELEIATTAPHEVQELFLESTDGGTRRVARAFIEGKEIKTVESSPEPPFPGVFLGARSRTDKNTCRRLDTINNSRKLPTLTDYLKHVDARINGISLGFEADSPQVRVDIGLAELAPIHVVGEGINRLVHIAAHLMTSDNGVVFVDEIDAGLHYTAMPGVWGAVFHMAASHNVQVFATTHSWECVKAAVKAAEKAEKGDTQQLAFYRLDRKNGQTRVTHYDQQAMKESIHMGLDPLG